MRGRWNGPVRHEGYDKEPCSLFLLGIAFEGLGDISPSFVR